MLVLHMCVWERNLPFQCLIVEQGIHRSDILPIPAYVDRYVWFSIIYLYCGDGFSNKTNISIDRILSRLLLSFWIFFCAVLNKIHFHEMLSHLFVTILSSFCTVINKIHLEMHLQWAVSCKEFCCNSELFLFCS